MHWASWYDLCMICFMLIALIKEDQGWKIEQF